MTIVLIVLFAIALTIMLAGFLLSPKPQPTNRRRVGHIARRPNARHHIGVNRRASVRRSRVEVERRAWTNIVSSLNIGSVFRHHTGQQTPWLGIVLILFSLFAFGIYSLNTLLPRSGFIVAAWANAANTTASPTPGTPGQTQLFPGVSGASKALTRISQLDPSQYSSSQEYDKWAYSACSAATLTEVFNAYGQHHRITDILSVESGIGEIAPDLGLVEPVGIDRTAARFGFKATWLNKPSVDDVVNIGNHGRPVIISFPPDRWSGGHILITVGGDSNSVYLADSSRLNMRVMPRQTFLKYWAGFAVVVTPN